MQFEQHRDDPICATCHNLLDPLGLPFEHYDGTGAWRDTDRGMALDVTGAHGRAFRSTASRSWRSCSPTCPETRACYATQWLRFANGRLSGDTDSAYIDWLMSGFTPDAKLIDLVPAIAQSDSFRYITPDARPARRRHAGSSSHEDAAAPPFLARMSRRTMLRGALGVGVALPWLELMRPRGLRAQAAVDAAQAVRRLLQPVRHHPGELAHATTVGRRRDRPTTDEFTLSPILRAARAVQEGHRRRCAA